MKILILNGPNLNLLGKREPHIYGNRPFETFLDELRLKYSNHDIAYFQSNLEGELIDALQMAGVEQVPVVMNPGGYTHTSVAIADAIIGAGVEVIEVHISNVHAREIERRSSMVSAACKGVITGLGLAGYDLAIGFFIQKQKA